MPDSVGNTLNTAQSISIGTTTQRFSDSVEFGDNDYFRFTLNSFSSFNLALSGLGANAEVEILDSTGAPASADGVLLRSDNEGTLVESINTILNPGTYYIRVFPGPPTDPGNAAGTTPSTNYNLDVRADNGVRTDIVWRYNVQGLGLNGVWRMNGTNYLSGEAIGPQMSDTRFQIQGAGDFNNDGQADLVWRFYGTDPGAQGIQAIWLLDGGTLTSVLPLSPEPDLQWTIRGVADFNTDGNPDLLWRRATGENRVWFLDGSGATISVASLPTIGQPYDLQAVGDFNGDQKPDLVWRSGGANIIWYLNGTDLISYEVIVPNENFDAKIQGAGDFNGDGNTDLLWRDFVTGANEIWLMQGAALLSIVPIPAVADVNWRAIAPFERNEPVRLFDAAGESTAPLDLGPLNGNGMYQDAIGLVPTDLNDYYRFSLGSPTRLNLKLDGLGDDALQGNLNVQILNSLGNVVAQGLNPGTAPENIPDLDLNPGTYFIRVFQGEAGAVSDYDLDLTVNNLPVLVSSGPLTVSEGSLQTISNTLLLVNDENDPPPSLRYTLVTPPNPVNGSLSLNGALLVANSVFTQADINQGKLVYRHNGGESVQDTFVFAVADGRGGTVPNTAFTINVIPVNDPPSLQSLAILTATEAAAVTISNTTLLVTDIEQPADQIFYSLNSVPTVGTLSLTNGPLTIGSTFTQADINANRLTYRQDGSETTTDSFTFTATDGAGGFLNPQIQTLSIQITGVNDAPVLVTNKALTVSQSGPSVIDSTLLRATDAEFVSPAQQDLIKFTITQLPSEGTLFLNGTEQLALFTFSQADLNANRISYAQNGTPTNSDRFNFTISDGVNTTTPFTYEIFVQGIAGPPVLATNKPLLVNEGAIDVVVTNAFLRVTDPDSGAAFLTYTLGALPAIGSLKKLGTALTAGQTFTQADINNGLITYTHNGNETPLTDSFTFTFKDESGAGPATTSTFSINVTPVNDLPTILSLSSQVTVTESFAFDLTSSILNVTDPDNLPQDVTYTIGSVPTSGTITRFGTAVTTFTQADVNSGQVKYQHNGNEGVSDSFTFRVADLSGTVVGPGTVNISVIPFNDAPGLAAIAPIAMNEGATAQFSNTNLLITDNDGPGPFTYTIGAIPTNGILRRGNVTLSAGGTFTQADIDNGQLFYVHSGSETTSDRFTFTASDGATTGLGAPGLIGERTFSITVTSINDIPGISLNQGITLAEDGTAPISNTILRTTDADNLTSQLTYNLSAGPSNGTLLRVGTATDTFTQADLDAGLISYKHNGSETTLDAFIFTVTDGTETTGAQTFNIAVTPVNDAPRTLSNNVLVVDEGSVANPISDLLLLATDPDGPSPTVIYTLSGAPAHGALLRDGVTLTNGQTFTQAQISGNLLAYTHDGSETTSDRFTFTASDGAGGVLSLQTFNITVNSINDIPGISLNRGITLAEDGTAQIPNTILRATDADNLTSQLTYNLSAGPSSGTLLRAGIATTIFTQADLDGNLISYKHDGSETTLDAFIFTVSDGTPATTEAQTFNITVTPVNDAPRTLSNNVLVVNEGSIANPIPESLLLATDPDGPSPTVIYTLSGAPAHGALLRDGVTLTNGQTFTQAQISGNLLAYTHDGSETTSDRFTFTASDGAGGVLSLQTFNITVDAQNDDPIITIPTAPAITVNEDQTFTFASTNKISVADPDGGPTFAAAITTTSGGTINLGTTSGLTGLVGNGSGNVAFNATLGALNGALNNLKYTGLQNFNGSESIIIAINDNNGGITLRTITMDVTAVNDAPTLTVPSGLITVNEDTNTAPLVLTLDDVDADTSPIKVSLTASSGGITVNDSGALTFVDNTTNGGKVVSFTGLLADVQNALDGITYRGEQNAFGSDRIVVTVNDQGATGTPGARSVTQTLSLNVVSVNDKPTFTGGAPQFVIEDAGQQVIPAWATGISKGAANESAQGFSFTITSTDPTLLGNLFTATPTIDPTTGNLTFTPRADANGTIQLTAVLTDNGGTANGGVNVSDPYIFEVAIAQRNDAPIFTKGQNITINEDVTPTPVTLTNWATNIRSGPTTAAANESTQAVNFLFETNNPSLFASGPQMNVLGSNGNLTFTPTPDANGTAIVTVRLQDDGGTANGGTDTSAPQLFTIVVRSVNDAPTFNSTVTTLDVLEDSGPQNFAFASGIAVGPANEASQTATFAVSNNNPSLFLTAPAIDPTTGQLTFTPAANASGQAIVTATLRDNGDTLNGGQNSSLPYVFTINVTAVNDAPTFVKGLDQVIDEDAPAQTVNSWATNILAGPNESVQTLTFNVSNNNPTLFSVEPTVSTTGVLTYTAAPNANGTAIVTVSLSDNGGTDNGGIDTSTLQTFTITVNAVNDQPTLTIPGPITTQEDTAINFSGVNAIQLTDIDSGTNPIRVTLSVTNGTVRLPSTAGLNVTSGANGSNTVTFTGTVNDFITAIASVIYTPNANYSGTDTLAISVNDQGATGKGGAKTASGNIAITVTAQNDPPVLTTLGNLIVEEAGNRNISNTLLRTTDVDNTTAQITYTLASTPTSGSLRLSSGASFITLGANDTFTQAQIDAGRLNYIQNGDETTSDSFSFSVSDGQIVLVPNSTFSIGIIPVNDPPSQVVNDVLDLQEGDIQTIDNSLLQFTDDDNTPAQLVYTITSAPSSGTLRLGGSDLTAGSTFTQEQIDIGLLTYEHSGNETSGDSFNFSLGDSTSSVAGAFNITVQPVPDPVVSVSSGPLTVNEGALAPISSSVLRFTDPDTPSTGVVYTLRAAPIFGNLIRGTSTPLGLGDTFTQAEIDSGAISYRHNGGENPTDVFTFDVSDGGVAITDIFNIAVNPVNDPPQLLSNRGLTLSQSTPTVRPISNSLLRATDVDNTDPAQVFFKLSSVPNASVGSIRLNGTTLSVGQRFSQADVNLGRVSYQYLGGGTSEGFQFSLEDAGGAQGGSAFFAITFTA